MRIGPCDFGDERLLRAVHALQVAAYEIEAAMIGTRAIPALHESPSELAASEERFWGCFVDKSGREGSAMCVGVIATEPEAREGPADDGAGRSLVRISRLAVRPEWFGRGVGGRLVRHAIDAARADGATLKVTTGAANAPGRRVYEREGFTLVGGYAASDGTRIVEYRWG